MLYSAGLSSLTLTCMITLSFCKANEFHNASDIVLCGDDKLNSDRSSQKRLVNSMGNFGHSLLQTLLRTDQNNIIISPLSVYSILTTLTMGSFGTTRHQLEAILGLQNSSWKTVIADGDYLVNMLGGYKSNVQLDVANRVFVTEDLSVPQPFQDESTFGLGGKVAHVDFKNSEHVVAEINNFVNLVTRGRIPKIVDGEFRNDTSIAIVSAVYFEGSWQFPVRTIKKTIRFNEPCDWGEDHSNWLQITGRMGYTDSRAFRAHLLRVPYDVGPKSLIRIELFIALPKWDSCRIDDWFKATNWNDLMKAFTETTETDVNLLIPLLQTKWKADLQEAIKILGAFTAFDQAHANFSRMVTPLTNVTSVPPTYLSAIHHETHLLLSASGTKARVANIRPRRVVRQTAAIDIEVKNSFYLSIVASEPAQASDDQGKGLRYMHVFAGLIKGLTETARQV